MIKALAPLVIAFCIFISSAALAAGTFTATVDRTEVPAGESVTLDLSVSGADPKGAPDLSPLDNDFTVVSQGQTSQTNIVNGQVTSSTGWDVVLIPKKEGGLTIPALTVDTDQGSLTSDPLKIDVGNPAAAQTEHNDALNVEAKVSKQDLYQNEPVLLTIRLIAHKTIRVDSVPELNLENAIVEPQGKPRVRQGTLDGQRVTEIQAQYLITPLKPGKLTIPPFTFQGQVETGRRMNPFGDGMDFPDPFHMMQEFNNIAGFAEMKPFAVSGPQITLNVKKPAAQMDPWLPLSSLKVGDEWTGTKKAQLGEPLTRKITMAAIGATGAVLPDLQSRIDPEGDFRLYADKPDVGQDLHDDGKVSGWRQESYTLIPQKAGKLTLPEIRIPWWDVENDKIAYAVIPEKTIDVAPAAPGTVPAPLPEAASTPSTNAAPAAAPAASAAQEPAKPSSLSFLYLALAALIAAVIVLGLQILRLQRKLARRTASARVAPVVTANEDKVDIDALKGAKTPEDLRHILQIYAQVQWGFPQNTALRTIAQRLDQYVPPEKLDDAGNCLAAIDSALYAGARIDVEDIKRRCIEFLKASRNKRPDTGGSGKKIGNLNPS